MSPWEGTFGNFCSDCKNESSSQAGCVPNVPAAGGTQFLDYTRQRRWSGRKSVEYGSFPQVNFSFFLNLASKNYSIYVCSHPAITVRKKWISVFFHPLSPSLAWSRKTDLPYSMGLPWCKPCLPWKIKPNPSTVIRFKRRFKLLSKSTCNLQPLKTPHHHLNILTLDV